jgi:heme/copper-type cytochrome/quinol oxidase subunit 1
VGAILLWASGAVNAIAAAVSHVTFPSGGSVWSAGNTHTVVAGAPTLIAVGAIYHWAPKLWGRRLNTAVGGLVFLSLFVGFFAAGLCYYLLGYDGAPLGQIGGLSSYQKALYDIAETGGALIVLGVLVLVIDLVVSVAAARGARTGDDPYDGLTLEWATSSPPPAWGFDSVPEVRSEAPLAYLRADVGGERGAPDTDQGEELPAAGGTG